MDTPRDDEELTGDEEPEADDDPSEEEELEALMAAASEQAAEGVPAPEDEDAAPGEDDDDSADGEPLPRAEAILDELDDTDGDDKPSASQEALAGANKFPSHAAAAADPKAPAPKKDRKGARSRAKEEQAKAAASLQEASCEARARKPEPSKGPAFTPPPMFDSPATRNNELARMLALVLAVAGLCMVSVAFLKLRERPPAPPDLPQLPANQGPLEMSATATELPAGVALVPDDGAGSPAEPAAVEPPVDTQVVVAPDPEVPAESEPLVDAEPDPEPEPVVDPDPEPAPNSEPPVVVAAQPAPAVDDAGDAAGNGSDPEDVVFAPEPPREQRLTAVQQLALLRGAAGGDSPAGAATEPVTVIPLSAAARRALEAALSTADREFVRALVEDAADLPAKVGNAEWARLRQMPSYRRTLQMLYDHVLSTDDKVRLVGGHRNAGEASDFTPDFVRGLDLPPVDLAQVREELWNAKREDITAIVRNEL